MFEPLIKVRNLRFARLCNRVPCGDAFNRDDAPGRIDKVNTPAHVLYLERGIHTNRLEPPLHGVLLIVLNEMKNTSGTVADVFERHRIHYFERQSLIKLRVWIYKHYCCNIRAGTAANFALSVFFSFFLGGKSCKVTSFSRYEGRMLYFLVSVL